MEKFSELPLVVHEIIADKIVHNLSADNRFEFALSSKLCYWLAQRVRPKKIIHHLFIQSVDAGRYEINSEKCVKTKEQMMEILQKFDIVELCIKDRNLFCDGNQLLYADFLGALAVAVRNLKKFLIQFNFHHDVNVGIFYNLYQNMKCLDSLVYVDSDPHCMPYYPASICLHGGSQSLGRDQYDEWKLHENFLKDVAQKTKNCFLSSFRVNNYTSYIPIKLIKEFLFVCFNFC